jgi:hypothetical protein
MNDQDRDTLTQFERRFAGIESEIKQPPAFEPRGRTRPALRLWAAVLATLVGVVVVLSTATLGAFVASGPSSAPQSSSAAAVEGSASPANSPSPTSSPFVPNLMVGDWSVRCQDLPVTECQGVAALFVNNLARNWASVFEQTSGRLTAVVRPDCPSLPAWADPTRCWQVSGAAASGPVCMVIAKETVPSRSLPYGQVGGDIYTGRAGPPPTGWPPCVSGIEIVRPSGEPQPSDSSSGDALPIDPSIAPVSKSHPSPDALAALKRCGLAAADPSITAMGKVGTASIFEYLPLYGPEPEIAEAKGEIWVIQRTGNFDEISRASGPITVVNPTCAVIDDFPYHYLLYGWTASDGTHTPRPGQVTPTLALPPLVE